MQHVTYDMGIDHPSIVDIMQFAILAYAFKRQSLMHPEIENNADIVSVLCTFVDSSRLGSGF